MKQIIINSCQENGTLSMTNQMQTMMLEMKLSIQKFYTEVIYTSTFIYKEVLKSNLYDFNDTYILVRCDIVTTTHYPTPVACKNYASFIKCITKSDKKTIDDDEDLDLVVPTYNLTECSSNYSETTGSLQFYLKDEANNFNADIANNNNNKF